MDPDLAYDSESGRWMCQICFEWITFDSLYADTDKMRWDICKKCGEVEYK